jgi:hypothetical protein
MWAAFTGLDANTILIAGIALTTLGNSILNMIQQYTLGKVKKTGEANHQLSNSAMGAQLQDAVDTAQEKAIFAHRIADLTKTAGDSAAATAADVRVIAKRKLLEEHLKNQAIVDAKA